MGISRSRAFILCVAIAFASSGFIRAATAGQPCMNHAPAASLHESHAAHHHPEGGKHTKSADGKCCGICIVASAGIVPAQGEMREIRATRIDYANEPAEMTGRAVVLDPGIPKRRS
jgi:hypothetical protein